MFTGLMRNYFITSYWFRISRAIIVYPLLLHLFFVGPVAVAQDLNDNTRSAGASSAIEFSFQHVAPASVIDSRPSAVKYDIPKDIPASTQSAQIAAQINILNIVGWAQKIQRLLAEASTEKSLQQLQETRYLASLGVRKSCNHYHKINIPLKTPAEVAFHMASTTPMREQVSKPPFYASVLKNINKLLLTAHHEANFLTERWRHILVASFSRLTTPKVEPAPLPAQRMYMVAENRQSMNSMVNPIVSDVAQRVSAPKSITSNAYRPELFAHRDTEDLTRQVRMQLKKSLTEDHTRFAMAPTQQQFAANEQLQAIKQPQTMPAQSTANETVLPDNLAEIAASPQENIEAMSNPAVPSMGVPEYVIIRSSDRVTFSSEISASVAKINVKEGMSFVPGAVLLELDCRVQQADLQKALAQQKGSHMALTSARKLKSYGSISEFEYSQALAQDQISNAEVAKLLAIVDKCTIRAPFRGAVSDVLVHQFETVKPGDPLIKIVGTENLDFELQVPSQWLQWLHVGSIFYVRINETGEEVKVAVAKINPQIDSVSQTVRIIGTLGAPNSKLLPGMSGQAHFPEHPDNLTHKNSKKD